MLKSRPYEDRDYSFFLDCVNSSPEWQEEECEGNKLHSYLERYKHLEGHWLIWCNKDKQIGISFTLDSSPSNGRPWLGTLLILPGYRRIGYGSTIVSKLLKRWANEGEKIVYAGIPIMKLNWSNFLSNCGFEQYKIEKEEEKTYLLFIKPIEMKKE